MRIGLRNPLTPGASSVCLISKQSGTKVDDSKKKNTVFMKSDGSNINF